MKNELAQIAVGYYINGKYNQADLPKLFTTQKLDDKISSLMFHYEDDYNDKMDEINDKIVAIKSEA